MLTAAEAEAAAVLAGMGSPGGTQCEPSRIGPYVGCRLPGEPAVTVLAGGIGPAAAAAATATALALSPGVDLVLNAGVAGGFAAAGVSVGDVVLATTSGFADLGAESPGGFLPAAELGWPAAEFPASPELLAVVTDRLRRAGLTVHAGPVLTVSTVTGTAAAAARLSARSRPVAEAMEGAAVAGAAARFGRRFLELRTVSNLVGDRDRDAWDVAGALDTLRAAMAAARPALLLESP